MSIFYGSRYETAALVNVTRATGQQNLTAFRGASPLAAPLDLFAYTVIVGDRIDALAYKFYGRADYWWLIADASRGVQISPLIPGTTLTVPNVIG